MMVNMRVKPSLVDRQNSSKTRPTIKDRLNITQNNVFSCMWGEFDTHILLSFEKVSFRLVMGSKRRINSTFKDSTFQNRKPISDVTNVAKKLFGIVIYASILIAFE